VEYFRDINICHTSNSSSCHITRKVTCLMSCDPKYLCSCSIAENKHQWGDLVLILLLVWRIVIREHISSCPICVTWWNCNYIVALAVILLASSVSIDTGGARFSNFSIWEVKTSQYEKLWAIFS
jgi:hypothetical protein